MRGSHLVLACIALTALTPATGANAHPAGQDGHYVDEGASGPAMRPYWQHRAEPAAFVPDPRERADWIEECHYRLTWNQTDRERRRASRHPDRYDSEYVSCADYYDDYYAAYATPMTAPRAPHRDCPPPPMDRRDGPPSRHES